jgi:hypothetical protein
MSLPRQVYAVASDKSIDLRRLDRRITALEHSSIATGNVFVDRFGHSSKLGAQLRNLAESTAALENSTTAPVDFDVDLPRRMPEGSALFSLHHRLVVLESS